MSHNIHEARNKRLQTAWTEEFILMRKRERVPLILLISIIALEVVHWLIF